MSAKAQEWIKNRLPEWDPRFTEDGEEAFDAGRQSLASEILEKAKEKMKQRMQQRFISIYGDYISLEDLEAVIKDAIK